MSLHPPALDFACLLLAQANIQPGAMTRISRFPDAEPYFGRSGGNRFDDPLRRYGVCYAGDSFLVAFAESILHDLMPSAGQFFVAEAELSRRHAVSFEGDPLPLADMTGVHLKLLGGTNDLSSECPYSTPQLWSQAIHQHPLGVDGFRYVSRHVNTGFAYALFDRAATRLGASKSVPLMDHPNLAQTLAAFNVIVF